MTRKILMCVLVCCMVFAAVSCDSNSLEQTYTTVTQPKNTAPAGDVTTSITTTAAKPAADVKVDNETPYDELITKSIDIHYVIEKYFGDWMLANPLFTEIAADIGVECLRKTDTYYSVHIAEQGGLFYLFYSDDEDPQKREVLHWFYVQKRLTKADFSEIKDGESTIEDIKKIDPTTQIFINLYHANRMYQEDTRVTFSSWSFLDDGILEFFYDRKGDEIVVEKRRYLPNFVLDQTNDSILYAEDIRYAELLPIDWLPE